MSNVILDLQESAIALQALRVFMGQQESNEEVRNLEKKLQASQDIMITTADGNQKEVDTTDGATESVRPSKYSYFFVMVEDEQCPYSTDDEEAVAHGRMREKGVETATEFGIVQETEQTEEIRQITLKKCAA